MLPYWSGIKHYHRCSCPRVLVQPTRLRPSHVSATDCHWPILHGHVPPTHNSVAHQSVLRENGQVTYHTCMSCHALPAQLSWIKVVDISCMIYLPKLLQLVGCWTNPFEKICPWNWEPFPQGSGCENEKNLWVATTYSIVAIVNDIPPT